VPDADVRLESWEDHDALGVYASVISIGALEHFARPGMSRRDRVARYGSFFAMVHRSLAPGGRLGLQTIAFDQASEANEGPLAEFFRSSVFPESMLPHIPELLLAAEPYFHVHRLTGHADDYARTCFEWRRRLMRRRDEARNLVGDDVVERYTRYLAASRLGFMRGDWTLVRLVMSARKKASRPPAF
jgi:cyclopropane-fatty-acyl-phospholipid synthase